MTYKLDPEEMHIFQKLLVGTWSNDACKSGLPDGPYSCNVMPLPQEEKEPLYDGDHHGFILKNFKYTEEISFHGDMSSTEKEALNKNKNENKTSNSKPMLPSAEVVATPGGAPNRGSDRRQVAEALFYDQVAKFAEGPGVGGIVHLENGAWLHLVYTEAALGPYPNPDGKTPLTPKMRPEGAPSYAKQISVPHGNSVLAIGSYNGYSAGAPKIPKWSSFPNEIDIQRYSDPLSYMKEPYNDRKKNDYENPEPKLTEDPLSPLREAIEKLGVRRYHHLMVSTRDEYLGFSGSVTNIPFENRMAEAIDYEAQYWIMSTKGETDAAEEEEFNYLAYFQNMTLRLKIGERDVLFPHITANVIGRVGAETNSGGNPRNTS